MNPNNTHKTLQSLDVDPDAGDAFSSDSPYQRVDTVRALYAALGDDIDYDNFNSKVARYQSSAGKHYESGQHGVWGVVYDLQERRS